MQEIVLKLTGLSCQHCVKRVQEVLTPLVGEKLKVSVDYAQLGDQCDPQVAITAIEEVGYQACIAQPDVVLALTGLSCQHCVKNTEKALSALEGVFAVKVTKERAEMYGHIKPNEAIQAVEQAGYQAVVQMLSGGACPKADLLTTSATDETEDTAKSNVVLSGKKNPDLALVEPQNVFFSQDQVTQLILSGMTCASCVLKVQKALEAVPQVDKVQVNLAQQSALIMGRASAEQLITAVKNVGYDAQKVDSEAQRREKQAKQNKQWIQQYQRQSIVSLILGGSLMLWGLLGGSMSVTSQTQIAWLVVGLITLAVMYYSGGHFFRQAWFNLHHKNATMDTLVALGTGVAWVYSIFVVLNPSFFPEHSRHLYFEASAMIIGLINLGKMLETKAKQRSSTALEKLLTLTPPTVRAVMNGKETPLPLEQVCQGMELRLQTGDRIGVDGEIVSGEAWIDESMLTGEPLPIRKGKGDKVSAGTLVTDGTVIFKAEYIGSQTRLARIIQLVRQAQSSKSQLGLLADKISSVFVPIVVVIAVIAAIVWAMIGPEPKSAYSLIVLTTVLIIACPCALGLATPMSITAGVGRAAEWGILVRDADALQKASQVDTIVLDKTGTLTQGQPQVVALHTFDQSTREQAIFWAACLEQGTSHPLAKAILNLADAENIRCHPLENFNTLKGRGVEGRLADAQLLLGNQTLLSERGISTQVTEDIVIQESAKGGTPVYLALNNQLVALFIIHDALREDSKVALQRLQQKGYHLVMLTGDQLKTAQAIAQELNISHVVANVLPEQKAEEIKKLQQQGRKVLMVGDGINDAPALAQADVSVAMGSGSDIAIETAELTLMRHSIHSVVDVLSLSKGVLDNMKQNLFGAFIYNVLGIPIAAGVLYPWTGSLLNPIVAGAAMALSSFTVVTNANRLLRFKVK